MFPRLIGSQPVANRFPPPLTASVATPLSLTSALPARHGPSRIIGLLPLTVGCCSPQAHRRPPRTNSATAWNNRYANRRPTRPNQPATGAIGTLRLHSHAQISHRLAENNRLQIGHATKSSTGWSNPYANRHLTRPNQPANGTISTLRPLYPTKSASHWRNPDASRHPTQTNHPATGTIGRPRPAHATETSTDWSNPCTDHH